MNIKIILFSLLIIAIIALFWLILSSIRKAKLDQDKFEKFLDALKIGQKYSFEFMILSNNPFKDKDFKDTITIIDIKKNRNDDVWVKFEFSDGSYSSCSVDDFYQYVVID
jgi:hypothetical protein